MTSIPSREPLQFRAGDTVKWTRALSAYTPDDGWTLAYYFNSQQAKFDATAADNGDGSHLTTLSATETATLAAGRYSWLARVSKAGEVFTVDEGQVEVLPDLAGDLVDTRSVDERLLEAIEAALLDSADDDQLSMSVDGVSISVMDKGDLLTVRSRLERRVQQQRDAARLRRGARIGGNIGVRM